MKKHNIIITITVLIFTLPYISSGLDLQNTELTKVLGKVLVKKTNMETFKTVPNNLQLAGALKRLDSGDIVKTQEKSGAEMILKETCFLTVKENSHFEIPKVVGQGLIQELRTRQGSFLFKVISGSDFKVKTSDVVAGVKGTLFEIEAVDDLRTILSLPNLEIGIAGIGGTNIHVYEGQVELQNIHSGKTRKLSAGEKIAAFGRKIMSLDKSLADGFGPLKKFDPLERLKKHFGSIGEALHRIPSNKLGFLGFNSEDLSMPLDIGKPIERLKTMFDGLHDKLQKKLMNLHGFRTTIENLNHFMRELEDTKDILKDLKGKRFVPEFPETRFPIPKSPIIIESGRISEIHIGDGIFISALPNDNCSRICLEPQAEGMKITEGEGSFRIRDFKGNLDGILIVKQENGQLINQIHVTSGELSARIAESPELVLVKHNLPVSVQTNYRGKTERCEMPIIQPPQRLMEYKFTAETFLEAQKAEHDRKVNEKRENALEKLGIKKENILDGLKKSFGKQLLKENQEKDSAPKQLQNDNKKNDTFHQKLNELRNLLRQK